MAEDDEAPVEGEAAKPTKHNAIGIDLGTTYSCVGIYRDGEVQIIANDQGNRTTPSYVAWTDDERLMGDAAKNQVASNPTNTVFDAKRLIGRRFDDPIVQADLKLWPFTVVSDGTADDKPLIQVYYQGGCDICACRPPHPLGSENEQQDGRQGGWSRCPVVGDRWSGLPEARPRDRV